MRKKIFTIILLAMVLALCACGSQGKVKVYETTEMAPLEHEEISVAAVVTGMDMEENLISFVECVSGEELTLKYHGGVYLYNSFGEAITGDRIHCGMVFDIVYYNDTDKLYSMTICKDSKTLTGIEKFSFDADRQKATYNGSSCSVAPHVSAYDDEGRIDILEISKEDMLTLHFYGDKLVSVVVELGHGYVRLTNQDTYIGGMVEIGYNVIVPVSSDMLLEVREGTYTLRINRDGYSQSKENVVVFKGKQTSVDLFDIAVPTGTATFDITPGGASLYVNGVLSSHAYTDLYGDYSVRIEAEGYKTFRGSFKINEPLKVFKINLTKLSDDDDDETTETTTEKSEETTDDDKTEDSDKTTDDETTTEKTTESTTEKTTETTTEASTSDIETDNTVTVEAPVGVNVYLDSEFIGVAPVTFKKTVGSHTITLYKRGCLIKSYTIQLINDGKDETLKFPELTPATEY